MTAKPHEDPNCKCKACEAWGSGLRQWLLGKAIPVITGCCSMGSIQPSSEELEKWELWAVTEAVRRIEEASAGYSP